MAQHLWQQVGRLRFCQDCREIQTHKRGDWTPKIYPICTGDPDDSGHRRRSGPRPTAPQGAPKVLEECA